MLTDIPYAGPIGAVRVGRLNGQFVLNPTMKEIELAIVRMKDAQKPMPPSGNVPAAQVAILEQWVASGLPKGTCGGTSASFDTPSVPRKSRSPSAVSVPPRTTMPLSTTVAKPDNSSLIS